MDAAHEQADKPDLPTLEHAPWASDTERFRAFGSAIDDIRDRAQARVGSHDLRRVRRLDVLSRTLEVAGRGLIALGPGPLSFAVGVLGLWVHKQLQTTEIGHTALHGAYNRIEGVGRFHSKRFRWQTPIDERSWVQGHNGKHHGLTNVAGQDGDINFGPIRLTADTPHRRIHYFQLPVSLLLLFPNFTAAMNLHFTGLGEAFRSRADGSARTWATTRVALHRALRKFLPYYGKEYLLYPVIVGLIGALMFGPLAMPLIIVRAWLGAYLSELLRDLYSGATILCGHVGQDTAHFPSGTRPRNKGERYAMQVEASNNYEVGHGLSLLSGALDLQIEHHLFPSLPTNRLREVAPQVRAAAAAHGIEYRSQSWPRTLWNAFAQITRLSRKQPLELALGV